MTGQAVARVALCLVQPQQHGLHQLGHGGGVVAGNGVACGHAAQPGHLALGQLARGDDAALAEVGDVQRRIGPLAGLVVQLFPRLAVTHAAHRWQVGMQVAACAQGAYLVHEACRQHGVKPLGNAFVQPGAVVGF